MIPLLLKKLNLKPIKLQHNQHLTMQLLLVTTLPMMQLKMKKPLQLTLQQLPKWKPKLNL